MRVIWSLEFISEIFEWFRDKDNRGAVQVLMAVVAFGIAWTTGLLKWMAGLFRGKSANADAMAARDSNMPVGGSAGDIQQVGEGATVIQKSPGVTINQGPLSVQGLMEALAIREAEVTERLGEAHGKDREILEAEKAELERRRAEP